MMPDDDDAEEDGDLPGNFPNVSQMSQMKPNVYKLHVANNMVH